MAQNGERVRKTLRYFARRTERALSVPVKKKVSVVREFFAFGETAETAASDIREKYEEIVTAKPSAEKDYVALGRCLAAKKLLYLIGILIPAAAIGIAVWIAPFLQSKFFTKTMEVNSPEMYRYTGKVCLVAPGTETVLFSGRLEDGRITGRGRLYDYGGNLVYEGEFEKEMYSGEGSTYYPNGRLWYRGSFAVNRYQGYGYLYGEDGALICEGTFADGVLMQGYGSFLTGERRYVGEIADGKADGHGKEYRADGSLLYEGTFAGGAYEGTGKLYGNHGLLYEGTFAGGVCEGEGKYYEDISGLLVYEGGFADGRYEGTGTLYMGNDVVLYTGEWKAGKKSGTGIVYDPVTGFPVYEGGFEDYENCISLGEWLDEMERPGDGLGPRRDIVNYELENEVTGEEFDYMDYFNVSRSTDIGYDSTAGPVHGALLELRRLKGEIPASRWGWAAGAVADFVAEINREEERR